MRFSFTLPSWACAVLGIKADERAQAWGESSTNHRYLKGLVDVTVTQKLVKS